MPFPRMTTRRLMIAVAVVALVIGGAIEGERRRARFHQLAIHYTERELGYLISTISEPWSEHKRKQWEAHLRQTAHYRSYFAGMSQKYQWAEKYPWLPVPPDSPPPK